MIELKQQTPGEVAQALAKRIRSRRKEHGLTQAALAQKAGMSLSSYKRFEQKGQIAFISLLWIAQELNCLKEFNALFATPHYTSMEEVRRAYKRAQRESH